jgi:DNA-binding response OmpR family regulator
MKKKVLVLKMSEAPLAQASLSRAFELADCEVLWTATVSDAVEGLTRHQVDLLLLDVNGQLRTGWGMLEIWKALRRGAPVVVLTDEKSEYDGAIAGEEGAVLQKPVSLAALVHTIETLLEERSPGAGPPGNRGTGPGDAASSPDDFREMLLRRYNAPYEVTTPYSHWGINE